MEFEKSINFEITKHFWCNIIKCTNKIKANIKIEITEVLFVQMYKYNLEKTSKLKFTKYIEVLYL